MQAQTESQAPFGPEAQGTFLPPIERPRGLMMKLVYAVTHRKFGKVISCHIWMAPRPPCSRH